MNVQRLFFTLGLLAITTTSLYQKKVANLVYVDKAGVLQYTKGNGEAAFFGVNHTLPFAYGYRSVRALGKDVKQEIAADVYHLARLGCDAFRVHVWDTEISDSVGNLLQNEPLDGFDYLIAQLKKRGIKIMVTPIAFWGNGYPERDERTPGFSQVQGKGRAMVNDTAIRAQEEYVRQFFNHVNPYTGSTYTADPDVIATEVNKEPNHRHRPYPGFMPLWFTASGGEVFSLVNAEKLQITTANKAADKKDIYGMKIETVWLKK